MHPLVRFAQKVIKTKDGCWRWIGARVSVTKTHSYGQFSFGKKKVSAHRAAWILLRGPIPDGLVVCHKCDIPMCVNPEHLFLGSQLQNMADMKAKGRAANVYTKTHCKHGHEFTAENTFRKENGTKGCRQCNRDRALRWKHQHLDQVREAQRIQAREKRNAGRV